MSTKWIVKVTLVNGEVVTHVESTNDVENIETAINNLMNGRTSLSLHSSDGSITAYPYANVMSVKVKKSNDEECYTSDAPEDVLKTEVYDIFKRLKAPINLLGADYAAKAAIMLYKSPTRLRLTYDVYPELGKENYVTGSAVERAIRHFIVTTIQTGDIAQVSEFLGCKINYNTGTITVSDFLYHIKHVLECRMNKI